MTEQPWFMGLIGIVIGATIAGAYNLRAKRNEYVNEYYKLVVRRRVEAYEKLENLIINLKTWPVAATRGLELALK